VAHSGVAPCADAFTTVRGSGSEPLSAKPMPKLYEYLGIIVLFYFVLHKPIAAQKIRQRIR